jgi:colicin import membrane protein
MARKVGGRWGSFAWSLLLHAAIVVAAIGAWRWWTPPAVQPTLAMEATVIDAKSLRSAAPERPRRPEPEPPPPEPPKVGPPAQEQPEPPPEPARDLEKDRREAERLEAERVRERREEEARVAAIEAQKAAEAEAKRQAEQKRLSAEKQAADARKAADDRAAADARVRAQREAELRRSLEAEERADALRGSPAADLWRAQIRARIERAWSRPPSARAGAQCEVSVTQVRGGTVTSVRVTNCTGGDEAMRESVERAVYNASPLPEPPDPAMFEPRLELTFKPND